MSGLSMCHGVKCDKRDTCARYMSRPSKHGQSWVAPEPSGCELHVRWRGHKGRLWAKEAPKECVR